MKSYKFILAILLMVLITGIALVCRADDQKPKPYPLKTCLVCDMKLGEMGEKPYVFVYQGQEIKVCDKSEKAEFDKDPEKYMKKLKDAEAKQKK